MSPQEISQTIKRAFRPRRNINYVLLFGSAACNKLRPQSDIDIFVGGRMTFGQRSALTVALQAQLKRDIDIVLAQEAQSDVALSAYAKGIKVVVVNKQRFKADYFKHYYAFEDALYLRKIKADKIKRKFRG